MASNTKIGLLLGLVVVFLIVFAINGLPGFDNAIDDEESSPIVDKDPPGIKPDINPEFFPRRSASERHTKETPPPVSEEHIQVTLPETAPPDETDDYTEPLKQDWPKVYIVCKGDNLADIAKKFYGPIEGNRIVNVKRIFEVNNKSLESPDKIYPGQKLIIPSLWASAPDRNGIESIFPESMFEKVVSIGRRHL